MPVKWLHEIHSQIPYIIGLVLGKVIQTTVQYSYSCSMRFCLQSGCMTFREFDSSSLCVCVSVCVLSSITVAIQKVCFVFTKIEIT